MGDFYNRGGGAQTVTTLNADDLEVDSGTLSVDQTNNRIGIGTTAPGTQLQVEGATPYITLKNDTAENTDGGCESKIIGEDHANVALGQIEISHSGSSDDTKGKMLLSTHNGSALTTALTISDAQAATFAGSVSAASLSTTTTAAIGTDTTVGTAGNTNAVAITTITNTGTTAGKDLKISAGSTTTGANNINGGDLILESGGGDGTGTSSMQFRTKVSGTDTPAERMRIHTDGNVGIGDAAPGTLLQVAGANAYMTLQNTTAENSDGGAETKIIFEDHGNNALGQIEVSHVGSSDDEKGKFVISTNNDSGLQAALTIDEAQKATFTGDLVVTGTTPTITIGDAGQEDTMLVFDGNEVDFRVGLDDGTNTLEIGVGSTHGTTPAILVGPDAGVDVMGALGINAEIADESVSGITAIFTAGEALVRGEVCYFKAADSKMWKAVATASATARCVAMAAEDISADATGKFLLHGFLRDAASFPSYTIGGALYTPEAEQNSENVPEQTAPDSDGDFVQVIGWAVTADMVFFNPSGDIIEVA